MFSFHIAKTDQSKLATVLLSLNELCAKEKHQIKNPNERGDLQQNKYSNIPSGSENIFQIEENYFLKINFQTILQCLIIS